MVKEKPGVMFYWETFAALDKLKPEKLKTMLKAIHNFAQHGEVPDFGDDDMLEFAWPLIEQKLIADGARYSDIVNKKKRASYERWWKKYAEENGLNANDQELKERWIDMRMNADAYESNAENADASFAMQNMPTTTSTSTPTATSTATTAGASNTTTVNRSQQQLNAPAPLTFGRYNNVRLTAGELAELKAEYPGKWEAMIENLSAKIAMKGYKFENHLATLRSWEQQDEQEAKEKSRQWRGYGDLCAGITSEDHENDCELPY